MILVPSTGKAGIYEQVYATTANHLTGYHTLVDFIVSTRLRRKDRLRRRLFGLLLAVINREVGGREDCPGLRSVVCKSHRN